MDGRQVSYFVDELTASNPLPSDVVQKFKNLRLEALRLSPASFLSTLAHEERFTYDHWDQLIRDASHHYLICHTALQSGENSEHHANSAADEWMSNDEWVGMLLLLGPYHKDQYGATPFLDSNAIGSDEEETRWHLTGLYLQPNSRCEESAIAIHEAILTYLRFWTDEHLDTVIDEATGLEKPKRARLTGQLRTESDQLVALYETLTGNTVGWADLELGCRIAGLETLPSEAATEELRMRVMERVIEC